MQEKQARAWFGSVRQVVRAGWLMGSRVAVAVALWSLVTVISWPALIGKSCMCSGHPCMHCTVQVRVPAREG